jgi:hypothetical protein
MVVKLRLVGRVVVVVAIRAGTAEEQDRLADNRPDPRFEDSPVITDLFDFSLGGSSVDYNTTAAVGTGDVFGSLRPLEGGCSGSTTIRARSASAFVGTSPARTRSV